MEAPQPPPAQAQPQVAAPEAQASSTRPNPGPFSQMAAAIHSVFPSPFKGIELTIQRPITPNFVVGHNVTISGKESSYHFRPTFVGTLRKKSEQEMFPIVVGDLSTSGDLSGNIIHEFFDGFKTKVQIQADSKDVSACVIENEYSGSDFTASFRAININPALSRGVWSLSYFQSVTQSLALGAEVQYQHNHQEEHAGLQLGGRYVGENWSSTLLLNNAGVFQATYMHAINPQVVAACDFEGNIPGAQINSSVGVKYSFPTGTYKAQITSSGSVLGMYEKQLAPAFMFILSFALNHAKGDSSVGIGLQIGG